MGLQRMSAGYATLLQALLDVVRGLYAMLSGFVLLLAGIVLTPWNWISRLFTRAAPVKADEPRHWKRFLNACRRVGEAVLDWTAFLLVAGVAIVALVLGLNSMDAPLREILTNPTNIISPIIIFLGLGILYLAGWLALRFGTALLAYLRRFLTRQGLYALAVVAVVILAGAAGAILYAMLQPTPLIALIAGVAVLAGVAGFALISFGPSGIAIFSIGRWSPSPVGRAGRRVHGQARSIKRSSTQTARITPQSAISGQPHVHPLRAIGPDSTATQIGDVDAGKRGRKGIGMSWSLPPLVVDRTGVLLVLAAVLAILLAWGGGELLLRAAPGTVGPVVPPVVPAGSPSTSTDNPAPATGAAEVIQLGADGESADVSWRSGYRALTSRLDDGRAVQQLSLPTTACSAAALVVFGAASSDGSVARNDMLAERRARWLGEWTRAELARCREPVPAIIAVALGQARRDEPSPAQRTVRILAIREQDMRNTAFRRDPDMLRNMSRAAFEDLDAFERFEPCMVKSRSVEKAQDMWFPVCAHQMQETGLSRSREPR
jgi:hypothetical protein